MTPHSVVDSGPDKEKPASARKINARDLSVDPRAHDSAVMSASSPSDPQSAWTAKANKRVQFGYGLNYLIDIDNAVIVDVEATPDSVVHFASAIYKVGVR
jgi:hypothetical protein